MSQHCFYTELSWIKTIAFNNNFTFFNNLILYSTVSLQLKNIFRSNNFNICFKVQHNSRRFLCNLKDPTPLLHRSIVLLYPQCKVLILFDIYFQKCLKNILINYYLTCLFTFGSLSHPAAVTLLNFNSFVTCVHYVAGRINRA